MHQGHIIALLAILDTSAPKVQAELPEWDDTAWSIAFAELTEKLFNKDFDMNVEHLKTLAPAAQFEYVLERFKIFHIAPEEASTMLLERMLQVFKRDNTAKYSPQNIHPMSITLFRAEAVYNRVC